ncbi:WD40 repeat [Trinorchestia longiramus]|nr:WD40 repeat [Trinorchestia longiramus]
MAGESKSQIVLHIEKNLDYQSFDVRWIPTSARLAVMGSNPDSTGCLEILEMSSGGLSSICKIRYPSSLKCGTFKASSASARQLAVGDFQGYLQVIDLTRPETPVYAIKAHSDAVNAIDGVGGLSNGKGAPELVTGGSDGLVKVWDLRQDNGPVVTIAPEKDSHKPDCWTVAAGNSYNFEQRAIASGFDSGDIRLVDLRTNKVMWGANVCNGVCSLEFDRRDIPMNKLVATALGANMHVFDLRTMDSNNQFAFKSVLAHKSTVWCARHLPQNRDVWMTTGGNGSLMLWQYRYPKSRQQTDTDGNVSGVPGEVECLASLAVSSQPITNFDWNSDFPGLGAFSSIDQALRVIVTTNLPS